MVAHAGGSPEIRVVRWHGSHEVAHSKKVRGPLSWVGVPIQQGRGYCKLVAKHGAAGLGVWVAILQLAGNRPRDERGVIPGTLEDVAIQARIEPEVVEAVAATLCDVGWLETASNGPVGTPSQHERTPSHGVGEHRVVSCGVSSSEKEDVTPFDPRWRYRGPLLDAVPVFAAGAHSVYEVKFGTANWHRPDADAEKREQDEVELLRTAAEIGDAESLDRFHQVVAPMTSRDARWVWALCRAMADFVTETDEEGPFAGMSQFA